MSNDNITTIEPDYETKLGKVVYQRHIAQATLEPEFKPGDTPETQFGNETLNGNIDWSKIVEEMIQVHYTQEQLVTETGISEKILKKIINKNYKRLSFRNGARLLAIHSRFYPKQYI